MPTKYHYAEILDFWDAALKCLYTNTHHMGSKQVELDKCVWLQIYNLIWITEMWWNGSYDWRFAIEGCSHFGKDRLGRQSRCGVLFVNHKLECMDLCLGMNEVVVKCLWIRIKGRTKLGGIIVGICYRPPDWEEQADEALYRQKSSFTFTGSGLKRGLQPPGYLSDRAAGHQPADWGKWSFPPSICSMMPSQHRRSDTAESRVKGHQGDWGTTTPLLWEKAEGVGTVRPNEKVQGDLINV